MSLHEPEEFSTRSRPTEPQPASGADPRVALALGFLSGGTSSAPLAEAARRMNLSSSRLRHLLRKETGVSPNRYLKRQRLMQAKEVLEATFLSVKEVMHSVGFTDYSHGVRDYKAAFGETPTQSRTRAWRSEPLDGNLSARIAPMPPNRD